MAVYVFVIAGIGFMLYGASLFLRASGDLSQITAALVCFLIASVYFVGMGIVGGIKRLAKNSPSDDGSKKVPPKEKVFQAAQVSQNKKADEPVRRKEKESCLASAEQGVAEVPYQQNKREDKDDTRYMPR